jgi:hypothetical protein
MFWPFKFAFKLIFRVKVIIFSVMAGMALAYYLQLREEQKSWGVVPSDRKRELVGDDLVAEPSVIETRSLTMEAAPSVVWPWLVQMGYGRGGWYSYDRLDIKGASADAILPEFQSLAVGDIVPTHPNGGFEVKVVEPEKALVLYLDNELVKSQITAAVAEKGEDALGDIDEDLPGGLQFVGAMGDMSMPEFRATWSFILEPEGAGKTRLVERFRVWTAEAGVSQKLGLPMMGLGVFAMTRKHMLGVKERAETAAANNGAAASNGAAGAPQVDSPVEA